MLLDITLKITPEMAAEAVRVENTALAGHLGTHFDVMDKEFPLEYTEREGIAFDISDVTDRDIEISDIDIDKVKSGSFVAFYSGYIERVGYNEEGYFKNHPQLSDELIKALVERGVSIIALDFGGIRRTPEHIPADAYCAEHGTFVVENLIGLAPLAGKSFKAHTYPLKLEGYTGIPCRVIAEI